MTLKHENIKLGLPDMHQFASYIEALREGFRIGISDVMDEEAIQILEEDPHACLDNKNAPSTGTFTIANGLTFNKVPSEILWITHDSEFIGEASFRFELNELLENFGGHIGYGIRPKYEGQGLGTLALTLIKQRAAERGLDKLLLTCSPENPASEKIIIRNGGVLEDIRDNSHYGFGLTKRFWVPT